MRMKAFGGHEANAFDVCFFNDSTSIPWNEQCDIIKLFQSDDFSPDLLNIDLGNTISYYC